eukprot:TRINITY_DN13845_c0_g1_i1.p1 TRINITY_DN13845_c0_g1~~TRINITY_DN13845_c0_g1_i1.p1  ORF type:complete len:747 (+),score=156.53 TRINITY_DN13845_c0_g1_i1:62-2302(+)
MAKPTLPLCGAIGSCGSGCWVSWLRVAAGRESSRQRSDGGAPACALAVAPAPLASAEAAEDDGPAMVARRTEVHHHRDESSPGTALIHERLEDLEVCPVELAPMFDPVRLIHVDESSRGDEGEVVPHLLSREAAARWLAGDELRRCPLCRVEVLRVETASDLGLRMADGLRSLAACTFAGGENVAHKAMKLLDHRLLSALGLYLPLWQWRELLQQVNDAGRTPAELLQDRPPSEAEALDAFLEALPRYGQHGRSRSDPPMVHSERSAAYSGTPLFWRSAPVRIGDRLDAGAGGFYKLLAAAKTTELPSEPYARQPVLWGRAVLLREAAGCGADCLVTCRIERALIGPPEGPRDEECFEPAVRLSIPGRRGTSRVLQGRLAATRGLWIGGLPHFDDFLCARAPGAAALLVLEPGARAWRLLPGASSLAVADASADDVRARSRDLAGSAQTAVSEEGVSITSGSPIRVVLQPGPAEPIVVEALFRSRRLRLEEECDTSSAQAVPVSLDPCRRPVCLEEALKLRERLILVQLRAVLRSSAEDGGSGRDTHIVQLGAVVSDFTIGRQESCSFPLSDPGVSRSHCVLSLQEPTDAAGDDDAAAIPDEEDQEDEDASAVGARELDLQRARFHARRPRLVAFDDGSLLGTHIRRRPLGIGPGEAVEVREGDVLRLGHDVHVALCRVSPVLRLDDHLGLAAFLERVGEEAASRTLRLERPRRAQTEQLLAASLLASRRIETPPLSIATSAAGSL